MIVDKIKKREPSKVNIINKNQVDIPIDKWVKCEKCKEIIYKEDLRKNLRQIQEVMALVLKRLEELLII